MLPNKSPFALERVAEFLTPSHPQPWEPSDDRYWRHRYLDTSILCRSWSSSVLCAKQSCLMALNRNSPSSASQRLLSICPRLLSICPRLAASKPKYLSNFPTWNNSRCMPYLRSLVGTCVCTAKTKLSKRYSSSC